MRIALRKMGNSSGVILPKPFLNEIGATPGAEVEVSLEGDRIIIEAARGGVRQGWAEASCAIAEAGDDDLVWPEFANADDELLEW